ncbi:MAG: hypothetical protein ACOVJ5_01930 [Gloeomargaritales cyanobacterium]
MSEQVRQEGEFKLQKKKAPMKKLDKPNVVSKVDLTTKPIIDAVQEQSTNESVLVNQEPKVGLQEVGEGNSVNIQVANEVNQEEVVTVIQEITQEEVNTATETLIEETNKAIEKAEITGKPLPENVEKLVSFMEETGGTVEDYVRLNADYSSISSEKLLKEYYKKSRPHLDAEEIDFLMEDEFSYDEDEDDERDIRKKKLAFKEEVAKAKNFLEDLKGKYYEEIKLRPGVTKEQQKATDFFNRYNEEQTYVETQHSKFKDDTKGFFSQDFKGFDFKIGEKNFRYGVQNAEVVADKQSNITNLVKKFLNDKGEVTDLKGYHKAMYGAENIDTIASHFYEQGKADAIKEVVAKSNNTTTTPRQTSTGEIFINGLKVKAINGVDSTKLKIKKFNN